MNYFKLVFKHKLEILKLKREQKDPFYCCIADIEVPFIELLMQNFSGLARVFITNAIINGISLLSFFVLYIILVSNSQSPAFI